jgi:hypothetical protein
MPGTSRAMNPIKTFKPTVGAHVHDVLNNVWMTLTAEDVADMERSIRDYGRKSGLENWDGYVLDAWLPPEATPPATIRTPGPGEGRSQLAAIRLAVKANATSDFMLPQEQVEAIISEARAEGVAEAIELVRQADLPPEAQDRLVMRLRQL